MTKLAANRVDKLDHAFELVLVLLSIIAAALYKHTGIKTHNLPPFLGSIPAALYTLFLPFFVLLPLWVLKLVTTSQKAKNILRTFLWSFITFQVWISIMGFAIVSGLVDFAIVSGAPALSRIQLYATWSLAIMTIFTFAPIPAVPFLVALYVTNAYGDSLPQERLSKRLMFIVFISAYIMYLLFLGLATVLYTY